jgi:hypothetical protein
LREEHRLNIFESMVQRRIFGTKRDEIDRLCGLVVRVTGYRSRGTGFDCRRYQIF